MNLNTAPSKRLGMKLKTLKYDTLDDEDTQNWLNWLLYKRKFDKPEESPTVLNIDVIYDRLVAQLKQLFSVFRSKDLEQVNL